jgi:hypothetical protein
MRPSGGGRPAATRLWRSVAASGGALWIRLQIPWEKHQDNDELMANSTGGLPGVATTAHGSGLRAAAVAQVRRTRLGDLKRGDVHKTHQSAPYLHAQLLGVFLMAGRQRQRGLKAATG